jgi:branched-chain amino acid transport system permease protein
MNSNESKKVAAIGISVLIALLIPVVVRNEYYLHILIRVFLNILVASGLYVIMTCGLVSFCHAAFMAIGGYASALLVMKLGFHSWLGLLGALGVTILIAAAFGLVLLRLKGTYFFIGTFAFGELIILTFSQTENPFGGSGGLMNIPLPDPLSLFGLWTLSFNSKLSFYYLALFFMVVPLWIVYRLERSRTGSTWTAIQQAEPLAQSVGIHVMKYKTIAFILGSAMGAVGGVFLAHYASHLNPGQFDAFQLMNYLTFVMVGGSKNFWGPVIGAILLTLFGDLLSLNQSLALYQTIVYGLVLIIVILFLPDGIASIWKKRQVSQ